MALQLVINTFGSSVRKQGEMFRVLCGGRHVDVAARKVQSLLITTGAHFSTDAIQLAVDHNIDVVLLDKFGSPYGRVWTAKMGSTAAVRRRQIAAADTAEGVALAKAWVLTKLDNQRELILELGRRRPDAKEEFEKVAEGIDAERRQLEAAAGNGVDDVRNAVFGMEGRSAAAYWGLIGTLPPANFRFKARSKHPARDPFNAMLNYSYGVLYSEVERACIVAGLDPFVGFLHTDNYNKQSLVYDLIEPFRIWADRNVTKLFTGRRCRETMFTRGDDGVILEKEAKELLLGALAEYLDQSVRYRVKSSRKGKTRQIKRRACIQAEAHTLANRLLGKQGGLPEIMETREVFAEENPC